MKTLFSRHLTRRQFLGNSLQLTVGGGLMGTLGSFQQALAATADTSGYKALVCVYLTGGNNGFNTIVPTGDATYATYAAGRRNLALERSSLLPLNGVASDGSGYGMHPSCPELQDLFNSGNAAVLCNVGTLVQPTTKAQVQTGSVPLPRQLFSHLDQQTAWWTSVPDKDERLGWAGRIADLYAEQGFNPRLAMNLNIGGVNYWQEGRQAMPYVLAPSGAAKLVATNAGNRGGLRRQVASELISQSASDGNLMVRELAAIHRSAADKVDIVNDAFSGAGRLTTEFPSFNGDFGIGSQLSTVARCIKAQSLIGDARQMFFVDMGGFDTHNNELGDQAHLLGILSKNLKSFWDAMNEVGMRDYVTVFTASDFGRTIGSNGDGSDHAWGNHHLIMGGAVRGGRYFGTMPDLTIGGPDDIGAGRVLPTTSTDQYAASLAKWFGVAETDLDTIFPNLRNFGQRTIDFI